METKHTPGNWETLQTNSQFIIGAEGKTIASVYNLINEEEERANAKLISAAPEMAAMLRELRHAIRYGEKVPQATMDARITRILTKAGL